MKLYDVDNAQQDDLVDSGQFTPNSQTKATNQVVDKYDDFVF
jgi:hypothetical protein